ncbi:DinB family protein [Streptomyces sp. TverLS-915]|uniref:DinB family protein n=1 Tax=Streptomyces sp. TverLS-915 TaxID=1839763 RepID=UPI000B8A05A1|nr:DinB family protein [Streptomyces sp. TverLS-915]
MSFNGPVADLHRYLQEAREAVLWKAEGLSEYDVRRPLTPTGTNLLGLVKHLAAVELGYFGDTFGRPYFAKGEEPDFHWTREPEDDLWARPEESRDALTGLYRAAWAHTDAVLAVLPLDAEGRVPWWPEHRAVTTLHHVLVRVLAETQRHAGHADITRELLDGRAGAGREDANLPEWDGGEWSAYREKVERAAREADPEGAERAGERERTGA